MIWADMNKYHFRTGLCKNIDEIQLAFDEYRLELISHLQKVIPLVIETEDGWSNM